MSIVYRNGREYNLDKKEGMIAYLDALKRRRYSVKTEDNKYDRNDKTISFYKPKELEKYKYDKDVLEALLYVNGKLFSEIPESLKGDTDLINAALSNQPSLFEEHHIVRNIPDKVQRKIRGNTKKMIKMINNNAYKYYKKLDVDKIKKKMDKKGYIYLTDVEWEEEGIDWRKFCEYEDYKARELLKTALEKNPKNMNTLDIEYVLGKVDELRKVKMEEIGARFIVEAYMEDLKALEEKWKEEKRLREAAKGKEVVLNPAEKKGSYTREFSSEEISSEDNGNLVDLKERLKQLYQDNDKMQKAIAKNDKEIKKLQEAIEKVIKNRKGKGKDNNINREK